MIDPDPVRRRLRRLDESVARLDELARRSRDEFLSDPTLQAAAERRLQVAIQTVLDIGSHVLSERGSVDWEEYRDVPQRLAEEGVISRELADCLIDSAGQRNVLVHLYLDVDPELVYRTLSEDLDAFREFAEEIEALL